MNEQDPSGIGKLLGLIATKRGGFLGIVTLLLVLLLYGEAFNQLPAMLQGNQPFWLAVGILALAFVALLLSFRHESRKQADHALFNITVYAHGPEGRSYTLAGATVTLQGAEGRSGVTDEQGRVTFPSIPTIYHGTKLLLVGQHGEARGELEIQADSRQREPYHLELAPKKA